MIFDVLSDGISGVKHSPPSQREPPDCPGGVPPLGAKHSPLASAFAI